MPDHGSYHQQGGAPGADYRRTGAARRQETYQARPGAQRLLTAEGPGSCDPQKNNPQPAMCRPACIGGGGTVGCFSFYQGEGDHFGRSANPAYSARTSVDRYSSSVRSFYSKTAGRQRGEAKGPYAVCRDRHRAACFSSIVLTPYFVTGADDRGLIRVEIPAGYCGTVTVHFISSPCWTAALVISLLAWAALICRFIRRGPNPDE